MRVAVIGATGFVGARLVAGALARGWTVRALARRPEALEPHDARIELVRGDLFDRSSLTAVARGVDAVYSVAGPPRDAPHDAAPYERAMQSLVAAVEASGSTRRLITLAGAAARLPGERLDLRRALLRALLGRVVMPDVIRTKDREVAVLAASSLDWTIVRPPRISEGRPTGIVATDKAFAGARLDVADLVGFLLDAATDARWVRRAPVVASA